MLENYRYNQEYGYGGEEYFEHGRFAQLAINNDGKSVDLDSNNSEKVQGEKSPLDKGDLGVLENTENNSDTLNLEPRTSNLSQIRFGLTAIKGLGEDTVQIIIDERDRGGSFASLQDFAERVPAKVMNKKSLEALAFSGALDEFGDRASIVSSLEDLAKFAREFQEKKEGGQMGLFGAASETVQFKLRKAEATKKEVLNWERESLGLFVSDHPLRGMDEYFTKFGIPIKSLEPTPKKKTVKIHGMVVQARKIFTKSGKNMAILTIEDTSGKLEVAIFPRAYENINPEACNIDEFLSITGRAEERDGKLNFIAEKIDRGDLEAIQQVHLEGREWEEVFKELRNKKEEIRKEREALGLVEKGREASNGEKQGGSVYKILIPTGTTKACLTKVKTLLKQNKGGAGKVVLAMNGKEVSVPFPVNVSDTLKNEIDKALGKAALDDGEGDFVF